VFVELIGDQNHVSVDFLQVNSMNKNESTFDDVRIAEKAIKHLERMVHEFR
jgi:hypothetical protein